MSIGSAFLSMVATPHTDPDLQERLEEHLAALEPWMPGLVQRLRTHREQYPDIPEPTSEELAAEDERIEAWLADPTGSTLFRDPRLLEVLASQDQHLVATGCSDLSGLNLERIHDLADDLQYQWAMSAAARYALDQGLTCRATPRYTSPRGLLVYGIGSGRHLPRLMEHSQADVVLIFEPDLSRLLAALTQLNLAPLLAPYSQAGRGLFLIASSDPDQAFEEATYLLSQTNLFVLDALLVCDCDPAADLDELRQRFSTEHNKMMIGYLGFFVDELHMLMNATTTFRHLGARVLHRGMVEPHSHHAVIAVSGPSLRQHLPLLKAERQRYTLFSGWSTLGTLLKAGIIPDFHCPMERHVVHDALEDDPALVEALAGMALVGPSSLDPRQISYYADRLLIFRSASTSSALYAEHFLQLIDGEGPITANMAAVAAVLLGFRQLHFFGADFGAVNPEEKRQPDALLHTPYDFMMRKKGVGDAEVHTDAVMLDARRALERLLGGWYTDGVKLEAYNYSEGLLISGAPETSARQFGSILGSEAQRQTLSSLPISAPLRTRDWAEQRWRLARIRQRCLTCLQALRQLVEPIFEPATLLAVTELSSIYSQNILEQIPSRLYRGTVFRVWFGLLMLQRRLVFPDALAEQEFLQECRRILLCTLDSLEALSFELFDYLEDLSGLADFNYPTRRRLPVR